MILNAIVFFCVAVGFCQAVDVRVVLCFSGNNSVETLNRGIVSIDSLVPGDYVKSYEHSKGYIFTRFVDYLHFEPKINAEYLRVTSSSGLNSQTGIEISKLHLIQRLKLDQPKSYHDFEYVFAQDLKIGDYIYIEPDSNVIQQHAKEEYLDSNFIVLGKVTAVETIIQYGAFAPLTDHGTLIVSNILTSCYANVYSHAVAHYALKPVRMISNFINQDYDLSSTSETVYQIATNCQKNKKYINPYALLLLNGVQKTSFLSYVMKL